MNVRRGIFFNSKSRTNDKINELSTEIPAPAPSSSVNQTVGVKKKIILNHSKRAISKTIYSGPRRIFSTNYKVNDETIINRNDYLLIIFLQANRTQLNHKAFFGGDADEYALDNDAPPKTNTLHIQSTIQNNKTKTETKQVNYKNLKLKNIYLFFV